MGIEGAVSPFFPEQTPTRSATCKIVDRANPPRSNLPYSQCCPRRRGRAPGTGPKRRRVMKLSGAATPWTAGRSGRTVSEGRTARRGARRPSERGLKRAGIRVRLSHIVGVETDEPIDKMRARPGASWESELKLTLVCPNPHGQEQLGEADRSSRNAQNTSRSSGFVPAVSRLPN